MNMTNFLRYTPRKTKKGLVRDGFLRKRMHSFGHCNAILFLRNRPLVTGETLTIGSQLRKTWPEKASQILRTNTKVELIFFFKFLVIDKHQSRADFFGSSIKCTWENLHALTLEIPWHASMQMTGRIFSNANALMHILYSLKAHLFHFPQLLLFSMTNRYC